MNSIYIYHYVKQSEVLGPGKRFCLWMQGCSRNCGDCIAKDAALPGGEKIDVDELFEMIESTEGINGVTISGGEPFEQPEALSKFTEKIRKKTNYNIIVFTGYSFSELKALKDIYVNNSLKNIDLLIEGEYKKEKNENDYLRGSSNQNFVFLSDRFLHLKQKMVNAKNRDFEVFLDINGKSFIAGIPPKGFLEKGGFDNVKF